MKKFFLLLSVIFAFGLTTITTDSEAARRLGSGKSMGTQRQATPEKAPTAAAKPATAPAAAPSRSWMGPLAGLAAGLGLMALASHFGFGEAMANMMMFALLGVVVMVAIGFFMRRRAAAQGATAGSGGMQFPGTSNSEHSQAPAYKVAMPPAGGSMIGSAIGAGSLAAAANLIPADFDVAGFERNAKVNFIRLQAANDAGDLNDIRQFTTPEMFAELKMEITERGAATQKSDVASVHSQVMSVEEEAEQYVVSVRFTGVIKTETNEPDESFDEIWHMSKSRQGQTGWVLCGIQQMS